MKYIIEIEIFRDSFRGDKVSWIKGPREVDKMLDSMNDQEMHDSWPSTIVSEERIRAKVDEIYQEFILDSAPTQICFPAAVLDRTKERTRRLNYYGPGVFAESLFDPIKTLRRDIIPRFIRSQHHAELNKRLALLETLPNASTLQIPLPPNSVLNFGSIDELPDSRRFTFNEVLDCSSLFNKFMAYLQKCYCSENLICHRMIRVFEERSAEKLDVSNNAWDIFLYFVAEGSAFEISLDYASRKEIMLGLASANSGIFNAVLRSVVTMLHAHFTTYQTTEEYAHLAAFMRDKWDENQATVHRKKSQEVKKTSRFLHCFDQNFEGKSKASHK